MLSSLPCFYTFWWSAIPTSCYILMFFLFLFMSLFLQRMHAWGDVCHLPQSSKSVLTGFLGRCMQYWLKNHWPDQLKHSLHTNCISNSATLCNNYISLLSSSSKFIHIATPQRERLQQNLIMNTFNTHKVKVCKTLVSACMWPDSICSCAFTRSRFPSVGNEHQRCCEKRLESSDFDTGKAKQHRQIAMWLCLSL